MNNALRKYLKSGGMRIAVITKDAAGLRDAPHNRRAEYLRAEPKRLWMRTRSSGLKIDAGRECRYRSREKVVKVGTGRQFCRGWHSVATPFVCVQLGTRGGGHGVRTYQMSFAL